LLNAAQVARTPNDRDRERVFAAMLAASMTSNNPPPMREKESVLITGLTQPLQPASVPSFPAPPRPSTRPARPDVTETLPPKRLAGPGLAWIAATAVAAVIGVGSYFAVASGKSSPAAAQSEVTEVQVNAAEEPAAAAPQVAEAAPQAAPPSVVQLEDVQAAAPKAEPEAKAKSPDDSDERRARKSSSRSSRSKEDGARVLFAAERAFRMGQASRAFEIVKEHGRRYPKSGLKVERNALRAQLLCELGRPKAARKVVLELEADRASDHVLASVDQSCAQSASANNNL
jgi:hypothetical protein